MARRPKGAAAKVEQQAPPTTPPVRVPAERWREIPALLRAITPERLVEMQRQLAHARETYFENPMRTAVSLVWFRLQALHAASGGQNRTNTR